MALVIFNERRKERAKNGRENECVKLCVPFVCLRCLPLYISHRCVPDQITKAQTPTPPRTRIIKGVGNAVHRTVHPVVNREDRISETCNVERPEHAAPHRQFAGLCERSP